MQKILKLLIFLGVLAAVLVALSTAMPDTWTTSVKTEMDASPHEIYPLLVTPSEWQRWTVWNSTEMADLEIEYSGSSSGVGATSTWTSGSDDGGQLRITEALPPGSGRGATLGYTMQLNKGSHRFPAMQGRFRVARPIESTVVEWELTGRHEGTILEKAVSKWVGLWWQNTLKTQMEESLDGLAERVGG